MKKKIKINDFLKNRVFVDSEQKNFSTNEKTFIKSLFNKHSLNLKNQFPNLLDIENSLYLIDRNYEYDIYSFKHNLKSYILKVNQDDFDQTLKKEHEILQKLAYKNISPNPVFYENINTKNSLVSVLITSREFASSFQELSFSDLCFNIRTIANTLSYLHEITEDDSKDETKQFVNSFLGLSDYKDILDNESYLQMLNKSKKFRSHLPILNRVKQLIASDLSEIESTNIALCHTNLNRSRILYRDEFVKFTNFHNSFYIDTTWDVVLTCYYLNLFDNKKEKDLFLSQYLKSHRNLNIKLSDFNERVNSFKPVCAKLILCKILALFFYEGLVYQSRRPSSYIKIINIYESISAEIKKQLPNEVSQIEEIIYNYEV